MNQTTVMMMVTVTITHDATIISDEEVATAAMAELRAQVSAGDSNKLDVGDSTVQINETSFDLITVVPSAYNFD